GPDAGPLGADPPQGQGTVPRRLPLLCRRRAPHRAGDRGVPQGGLPAERPGLDRARRARGRRVFPHRVGVGARGRRDVRHAREAREYYQYKRRCLYCDMLRQEIAAEERVVRLTPAFAALVPYAPRGPLETWVLPRQHGCSFEEGLTAETARELARLLSDYFRTL